MSSLSISREDSFNDARKFLDFCLNLFQRVFCGAFLHKAMESSHCAAVWSEVDELRVNALLQLVVHLFIWHGFVAVWWVATLHIVSIAA